MHDAASLSAFVLTPVIICLAACSSSESLTGGLPSGPSVQEPGNTAGWQTHSNAAFNYAVEYPANFVLLPESATSGGAWVHRARFLERQLAESETAHLQPPNFNLEVYTRAAGVSLRQWLDTTGRIAPSARVVPFTVRGASEAVGVVDQRLIAPNEFYYAVSDRYVYRMTPIGDAAATMLSSFRLTP